MPRLELLGLDLRSDLPFSGLENPPMTGAPLAGKAFLPDASGALAEAGLGEDMDEGQEELFLFDPDDLVVYDPDEGPLLRRPLPRPRFYGQKLPARAGSRGVLSAGHYVFMQWRPRDEEELAEGLEWFAREAWWERAPAKGPYFLRRVREDGRLATQALRKTD